jgi:alpha-N-arabinofuranosidase
MTGLERNADVVTLASYAPLFAHVDAWQWSPDLIWVDNLNVYGTPSYYVQKLFSTNKGTHILPFTENGKAISGADSLFASAVWDENSKEVILKVTNAGSVAVSHLVKLAGVKKIEALSRIERMQSDDLETVNSIEESKKLSPKTSEAKIDAKKKSLTLELPAKSFSVYKIKVL